MFSPWLPLPRLTAGNHDIHVEGTATIDGKALHDTLLRTTHVTATQLQPGQIRATQMDGSTVYDAQNQKVGDIKDIILDRDGKVAAVVLDVGAFLGIGGKNVAIGMSDLKITQDDNNKPRFTVDMTKDQLKSAQAYDLNGPSRNSSSGSTTAPSSRSNTGSNTEPATPGTPPKQ